MYEIVFYLFSVGEEWVEKCTEKPSCYLKATRDTVLLVFQDTGIWFPPFLPLTIQLQECGKPN